MRTPGHPASRRRRGITLVEVIIALVLLSVGLLGIAGSSALLYRSVGEATEMRRAISRASLRLVRLDAAGCAAAGSGVEELPGQALQERWDVSPGPRGSILTVDSITWIGSRGARQLVTRSALTC